MVIFEKIVEIWFLHGSKLTKTEPKWYCLVKYHKIKHILSSNYHFRPLVSQFSTIFKGVKLVIFEKIVEIWFLHGSKLTKTEPKWYCLVKYHKIKHILSSNYHFRPLVSQFSTIFMGVKLLNFERIAKTLFLKGSKTTKTKS